MADITLTIDGQDVTVPEGTNVVDAARTVGIDIPVFCYHPCLKAVGMCRMCLVSVGTPMIDRATGQPVLDETGKPKVAMFPKLQTACTTVATPGMVVYTSTDEVKAAQRGILEFLLTSHPLDCPVCDKGGECPLQNLTMEWGPSQSRYDYSDKVHFKKPVPLGDLIYLDRERCILCSRCVRFQDDVAGDPVLGFNNRGRAWHIISESDPPFDSKFSGNTTDICPVGALTTADFRFKARVWELRPVPSLCLHCSVGCNITLDMRYQEIKRVMPRENAAVNGIWLCDKGRFGQRFVESPQRLTTPLVRRGKQLVEATWDEALQVVAENIAAIYQKKGGEALAGLAGHRLSNEDLYLFQRYFRNVLGSNNLDHRVGAPGEPPPDDAGALLGVGSGTNLHTLGKGAVVLVIGADPEEEAPLYLLRLREMAARGGEILVANARQTKLDNVAVLSLRYRPGSEMQVVRSLLRALLEEAGTQYLPSRTTGLPELRAALSAPLSAMVQAIGLREEDVRAVAQRFLQAEHGIILYGADALAVGPSFTQDLGSLALLAGKVGKPNSGLIALLPWGNTRGVLDMGVRPDRGPVSAPPSATAKGKANDPTTQPGLSAREMWGAAVEGRLKGMYLVGIDPVTDYPASRPALEQLAFLVVQDIFLTPTAQLAHVVLPAAAFAERDGTYTNAERRVQRARQARQAPGVCWPDWEIVQAVARKTLDVLERTPQADETGVAKGGSRKQRMQQRESPAVVSAPTEPPPAWDYVSAGDVAAEIAERVEGYQGITYTRLASTGGGSSWGQQRSESFFYDGTSYTNVEGVGVQCPSLAEKPTTLFSLKPIKETAPAADSRYPFLVLRQRLLYDADALLCESLLLSHVPTPCVVLNETDASRLNIQDGERVLVASVAGSLHLVAHRDAHVPEGSVRIPSNLPGAPLSVLETGGYTFVAVTKL